MFTHNLLGKLARMARNVDRKCEDDAPFPHCDPRVLHAPGECSFCDLYPHYQELRQAWSINFTGHDEEYTQQAKQDLEDLNAGRLPSRSNWNTPAEYRDYVMSRLQHCKMLPCPANYNRDQASLDHWGGNVPTKLLDDEV